MVVTKNPLKLLESKYLEAADAKKTLIEAAIISLDSKFFEPNVPPQMERIEAARKLIDVSFNVAIRIEPIIPRFGEIPGQPHLRHRNTRRENLRNRSKTCHSKMSEARSVDCEDKPRLLLWVASYYKTYGIWTGNCYELEHYIKRILHIFVYSACLKRRINYSIYLDRIDFPYSTVCDRTNLLLLKEEKKLIVLNHEEFTG